MENIKHILIIALLTLFSSLSLYGQSIIVNGKVLNSETKEPIEGVQIYSKTAKSSVFSDSLGNFTIELKDAKAMLRFQMMGFVEKELPLLSRKEIIIYLDKKGIFMFQENYVTPDASYSIADKVGTSKTLEYSDLVPSYNTPDLALQGRFAGLQVIQKSGMPGEGTFVQVRGQRSLLADNAPLIVVDGMPYFHDVENSSAVSGFSRGSFSPINLKGVSQISLLKGADAAAYGSLGSNGVLLIETTRSQATETEISFHSVEGIGKMSTRFKMLESADFMDYMSEITLTRFNSIPAIIDVYPFLYSNPKDPQNYLYVNNTDWQDEIYQNSFSSENVLRVMGGDAVANYAINVGVLSNKGVLKGTKETKYYTNLNADVNVNTRMKLSANAAFNYGELNVHEQGLLPKTSPFMASLVQYPILSPYAKNRDQVDLPSFNPTADMFGYSNPSALVNDMQAESKSFDVMVALQARYKVTSNLNANVHLGVYYNYIKENFFASGNSSGAIASLNGGARVNTLRAGSGEGLSYYLKGNLQYNKEWEGGHQLATTLAYQLMTNRRERDAGSGVSIKSDFYKTLGNIENAYGRKVVGFLDQWNWVNTYFAVNYNYAKQWYISAQATMDASSTYGTGRARAVFLPTIQTAWNIKNSQFLKQMDLITDLRIRAEYGINANSRFTNKLGRYYYQTEPYRDLAGMIRVGLPNSNIGPEKVIVSNIGLDFSLINNRISLSVDLFEEHTKDMLVDKAVGSAYGDAFKYSNDGEMLNRGFDLSLDVLFLNISDFSWRIGGNISHYDTEIKSLGAEQSKIQRAEDGTMLRSAVGLSPNEFYGHNAEKVIQTKSEAKRLGFVAHSGRSFLSGDVKFTDVDNNLIINEEDRVVLGKSTPDYFGGFYSHMEYKGFSLLLNFTYSTGNEIYNAVRREGEGLDDFHNQYVTTRNRWRYEGQGTSMPRAVFGDPMGNSRFSSRWIEDGSYLKLKEVMLSYEFDRKLGFFNDLQLYVTGENLVTWTKYVGIDPEFASSYDPLLRGVDVGKIGIPRNFKIGLIANF